MKYLIPLTIFSFLLFGCLQQHTIFYQIDQETKLEDAVITGSVTSVVKFNGKLYACDGNIYSKAENAVRGWSKISGPGGNIIKLAADTNNLYALNSDKTLYTKTDASEWSKVTTTNVGTVETIFDNGKDAAYLKGGDGKFYKLANGASTTPADSTISSIVILKTDKGTYTANGGTVSGKGNNGTSDLGSASGLGSVYSLTYSEHEKAIYAGTSKGLRKLPVEASSGKLTGANQDPPGNWVSTIKSYEAFAVIATGSGSNAALYTSTIGSGSAYVKVNGLWGYYYSRRDTWNRE